MKPIIAISLLLVFCLLQACEKPGCGCAPPLASELMGKWEWVKTVTPSRTITPQTAQYTRILHHENDGNADYVAFYQNDSLYLKLVQSRTFYEEDKKQLTVLEKYGSQYLKYYLTRGSDHVAREIQTSELMKTYTEKADTIRHYYKFVGR